MTKKRWVIPLGIGLAAILCCYLAVCGLAAFLWQNTAPSQDNASVEQILPAESTPVATPVHRDVLAAERQTGSLVARPVLPQRDLIELAARLQNLSPSAGKPGLEKPAAPALGEQETFWLHNVTANSFFTATASLQYETPHAYWWVEDGYLIPQEDLEESARRFEARTYPTNHRYFGSEWNPGIDGDPHIYIFLGNVPGVGGYFSSPDEYPAEIRPMSNEHEMFYINLDNAQPGNAYFDGILSHELQHMIHWASDRNEDTWINEGMAELAGHVNGYDVGGSDWLFTEQPRTQLTTWPELEDSGPHYGASYLFLTYFLEQFGEDAIRQLTNEPANGAAGFEAVLEKVDPARGRFDELFADWVIANYLDDRVLADGRYGYRGMQIDRPRNAAYYTAYPAEREAAVPQYAADYIVLKGKGNVNVEFSGSSLVSLLGNQTHSGEYQWWSVRGDEGDARLTRDFDLSGLERATLEVWMWYALEDDYDYAYVEVSADGGQTWDLLGNEHTTTSNPNGNSYGPAFTGLSGSGDEADWVLERFDLSAYAGSAILVRFEVITDDTVNLPGLCLDDITIPELGYHTDAESGADGWQAEGWLQVTDQIPQSYIVQLITFGAETRVERVPLDEQMQGGLTLSGLGEQIDRAVLVVAALAPATTERATYSYRITH